MSWLARLFILLAGVGLAVLAARTGSVPADAVEAFKDDWPAPDEDSIEYLKSVDLRTLLPREPTVTPLGVDLFGEPLPPGASGRLCYPWGVACLAVSADGQRVATAGPACSERSVELFETSDGRLIRRLGAHRGLVEAMVFSADGKRLAVARGDASRRRDLVGTITVYDLDTFEELRSFGEGTGPRALAFATDGTLVSGGGDGLVWVWDAKRGVAVRMMADLTRKVIALAFSPDGKQLATSGGDGTIRVWDFASGTELQQLQQSATMLAWSPDGQHLATNRGLWHLPSGQELPRFQQEAEESSVAFSPDGRTMVRVGDQILSVREISTGQERRRFDFNDRSSRHHPQSVSFVMAGRVVLTGQAYGEGLLWNVSGLEDHAPPPRASDLEALMVDLANGNGSQAYSAMWQLAAAGPPAVPLLLEQLQRQAARPTPDPRRIAQLLVDLDDRDFHVRDRATQELEQIGREAEKALRAVLADRPALEVRVRVERILTRILERGMPPHQLFRLRGIEALETQGSPEARRALATLADSVTDPDLKADARRSLERLERRR